MHPRAVSGSALFSADRLGNAATTVVFALTLIGGAAGVSASGPESPPAGRLAPPRTLQCDRNRLTSFSGTVTRYQRSAEQTRIEITTDWGSVEAFTLPHPDRRVERLFLLWGEPFQAADWSRVETAPGQLAEGLQAIVWVCEDPAVAPVVDWRPRRRDVSEQ